VSTKIYDAYRIKPDADVWAVLEDIRDRGEREVVNRMKAFYCEQMDEIDPDSPEYQAARLESPNSSDVALRLRMVETNVREGYKRSVTRMEKDRYDLNVSVAMSRHGASFYVRAFCDSSSLLCGSLDFLKRHPGLEDFHYQDQADRPKGISEESWEERRRVWGEMMDKQGFIRHQYIIEISCWDGFWKLNPWLDLSRKFHKTPPVFPIREEVAARHLRAQEAMASVEAEPGRIVCVTKAGETITIAKARKKSQRGQWVSRVGATLKRHGTLGRAVDHVYMEHATGWIAEAVKRHLRQAKKARKAKRRREEARASSCR
jgi:hypothetical protein